MPVYWSSWEDYVENVHPSTIRSRNVLGNFARQPLLQTIMQLGESRIRFQTSLRELERMGFSSSFSGRKMPRGLDLSEVYGTAIQLIRSGEEILLLHSRLAESDAAYGFLHSNDLSEHWQRYLEQGNPTLVVHQLYKDAVVLDEGLTRVINEDQRFLLGELNLPPHLREDFWIARDLFSVGFDEDALFIAARGFERVLREAAKKRRLEVRAGGKTMPVWELDLFDLIEALYRVRWRVERERLIDQSTKSLLHHLRIRRNQSAHPTSRLGRHETSPRETAMIIARMAQAIWTKVTSSRARLSPMVVQKDWGSAD